MQEVNPNAPVRMACETNYIDQLCRHYSSNNSVLITGIDGNQIHRN
jgi:hypothetical protein